MFVRVRVVCVGLVRWVVLVTVRGVLSGGAAFEIGLVVEKEFVAVMSGLHVTFMYEQC